MTTSRITVAPIRQRVTWIRWDKRRMCNVTSHPYVWVVTEPDGYERNFDTRAEAVEWVRAWNVEADYVRDEYDRTTQEQAATEYGRLVRGIR